MDGIPPIIPPMVPFEQFERETERELNGGRPAIVRGIAEFLSEYRPINYTIDGLVPGGTIYGVTAKRSAGKTALLTSTALAVSTGREDILGLEVEEGRVAYIILENPTDFRMKLSVAAFARNVEVQSLDESVRILDMRLPHERIMELLKRDADRFGPFQLVNYDTFQAGFAGADFNDNNDTLKHAQSLRELTTLPGKPSVLVACHPVKNPARDNLEPYGGGSTMNEFDGNLTLWNESGIIELHYNKVRGPEFAPIHFQIKKLGSPEILDNKGRQPLLPVLYRMAEQSVDERAKADNDIARALLRQLRDNPSGTQKEWAEAVGRAQSLINSKLHKLRTEALVENTLGSWSITTKGVKALKDDTERPDPSRPDF
jgi:hypothetical protein